MASDFISAFKQTPAPLREVEPPPPPAPEDKTHTVQPGEQPSEIAAQYKVSEPALRQYNDLGPGQAVYPGTVLNIPGNDTPATGTFPATSGFRNFGADMQGRNTPADVKPIDTTPPPTNDTGPADTDKNVDPTTPEGLNKTVPSTRNLSPEDQKKTAEAANKLKNGSEQEKIDALGELSRHLSNEEIDALSKQLGVTDDKTVKSVRGDEKAMAALRKLASTDPDVTPEMKVDAAIAFAQRMSALGVIPGKVGTALSKYLEGLPSAAELKGALDTLGNSDKTPAQKAAAALKLASALGDIFPGKLGDVLKPFFERVEGASKIIDSLNVLSSNASPAAKVTAALQFAQSTLELAPGQLKDVLNKHIGPIKDGQKLVSAIDALINPKPDKTGTLDRAKAALALAKVIRDCVGNLSPTLAHELRSLDSSFSSVANALVLLDPNASLQDKAQAALELTQDIPQIAGDLKALKEFLGKELMPQNLANNVVDAISRMPAVDRLPKAIRDKLPPNMARDMTKEQASALQKKYAEVKEAALKTATEGVDDPAKLRKAEKTATKEAEQFADTVTDTLRQLKDPKSADALIKTLESVDTEQGNALLEAIKGMKPGVADKLLSGTINGKPAGEILASIVETLEGKDIEKLGKVLLQLDNEKALQSLLSTLSGTSDHGMKNLLNAMSDLKPGVAQQLLIQMVDGKPAAAILANVAAKLGPKGSEALGKLMTNLDEAGMQMLLRVGKVVDVKQLEKFLSVAAEKAAEAGKIMSAMAKLFDKIGVEFSLKVASKIILGLTKAIPTLGAIPAVISAAEMAAIAANPNLPPDIRFLAMQAGKMNGVDAGLSLAEALLAEFVAPVIVDVLLAVAEIVLEVIVTDQQGKFENATTATPYHAPDWLKALNVAMAASQPATGAAELALFYGPKGASELVNSVARMQGTGAAHAAKVQGEMTAQGIGDGLRLTTRGVRTLTDMLRNPDKYSDALKRVAIGMLNEAIKAGGELKKEAERALGEVAQALLKMGKQAKHTLVLLLTDREAVGKAVLQAATAYAQQILTTSAEGFQFVSDVLAAAAKSAGEASLAFGKQITDALNSIVQSALAAGQQGIAAVNWVVTHPGEASEIAKQAVFNMLAAGGEAAKQLWQGIVALGSQGQQLAMDAVTSLAKAGATGVEMLKFAIQNPGEAADNVRKAALQALSDLARNADAAGKAAAATLVDLWNSSTGDTAATIMHLINEGGKAAQNIADSFDREVTPAATDLMQALYELGAEGQKAIANLALRGVVAAVEFAKKFI